MLLNSISRNSSRQKGVVLLLALVALVILTMTGIALMRAADLGLLVSGNMALKASAVRSADQGVEIASKWLYDTNLTNSLVLNTSDTGNGYSAHGLADDALTCSGLTTSDCWDALQASLTPVSLGTDPAGNAVSYLVQRLCPKDGAPDNCATTQLLVDPTRQDDGGRVSGSGRAYYRAFVRVAGPKGTVGFLQAVLVP